jgi:hypothetical protein
MNFERFRWRKPPLKSHFSAAKNDPQPTLDEIISTAGSGTQRTIEYLSTVGLEVSFSD